MSAPEAEAPDASASLFAQMEGALRGGSLSRAVQCADALLELLPGDQDVLAAKVGALLHGEQYEAALAVLGAHEGVGGLRLERAYCLYRTERHAEALALLERGVSCGREACAAQLSAQLLFRLGRHGEAASVLDAAAAAGQLEGEEAQSNVVAAYVAAGRSADVPALLSRLGLRTAVSDVAAFNVACARLACGELDEAAALLDEALRLSLEEGGEEEALPVRAQQAHLLSLRGRRREAVAACSRLLRGRPSDAALSAVLVCNLVALRGGAELLDSLKRVERALETRRGALSRLLAEQTQSLQLNRASLLLLAHRQEAAAEQVAALAARNPAEPRVTLLQAAALAGARGGDAARAEALLAAAGDDPRFTLMRAQLAAGGGVSALPRVEQLLQSLPQPLASASRVVATRVALLEARGEAEAAVALLEAAAARGDEPLVLASARAKAAQGRAAEAVTLYERLLGGAADGEARARALRGLVSALAELDLGRAEALAEQLPAPPCAADAEELDSSPALGAGRVEAAAAAAPEARPSKKARRKPRFPAGFDPAAPNNPTPDPERWLPRRERAAARKKKGKGAAALRGSQGSAPAAVAAGPALPAPAAPFAPPKGKTKGK